jgi:hypothetical protein
MKVTETQRLTLRERLTEALGPESAMVLMEALPPVDYDSLATKTDLEAVRVTLEARIDASRSELRAEMAELRGDLRSEMAELRGGLRSEMAELRGDLRSDIANNLKVTVAANIGSMVGLAALIVGLG